MASARLYAFIAARRSISTTITFLWSSHPRFALPAYDFILNSFLYPHVNPRSIRPELVCPRAMKCLARGQKRTRHTHGGCQLKPEFSEANYSRCVSRVFSLRSLAVGAARQPSSHQSPENLQPLAVHPPPPRKCLVWRGGRATPKWTKPRMVGASIRVSPPESVWDVV